MSGTAGLNYSLDLDGSGVINPNAGGFTTSEKYTSLSTNRSAAGGAFGADVAHVVSSGGFNLNAGEHIQVAFAIIAGDSLTDIQLSADSAQVRYDGDALSIEDNKEYGSINIYPNPTNGIIKIQSDKAIKQVFIRNVLGEIVIKSTSKNINISNYSNGIYFVEVLTEKDRFSKKIVLLK